MGRRKSFLGVLVREMEKSANRAAADARRQERRHATIRSRALEREMVRQEREYERARARAERATERQRINDERQSAIQQKQDAKDAQIKAWKLEFEECQEREQDIDRIANDAPEVEDRDRLYAELAERQPFEPTPFVAPHPPSSEAHARKLRNQADQDLETALASFRPDTRIAMRAEIGAGVIGLGGTALFLTPDVNSSSISLIMVLTGIGGVVLAHLVKASQAKHQRDAFRKTVERDIHARLDGALQALMRESQVHAQAVLQKARSTYEAEIAAAHAKFDAEENDRLQSLRELGNGDVRSMREALEEAFPLELPVPCTVSTSVQSSTVVSMELDVPEPSVLPTTEAKLLASGKVSYKEKSEKRLCEQYLRLVAGLALRHASEAMLNLPTCHLVEIRTFRTMLDPSVGRPARIAVMKVRFDYSTLAPMTMDGIDPVAALRLFEHKINIDKSRKLMPLDAGQQ